MPVDSEVAKAGFKNICEIGKERIRRAGEKIKRESSTPVDAAAGQLTLADPNSTLHSPNSTLQTSHSALDTGFRVFKVDDSNMKDVYYAPVDLKQADLPNLIDNIKEDRTELDLLFGCLLDWGLPLSLPYFSEKIGPCTVHTYNNGDLIACFDANIPEDVIREIAQRKPLRAVFRDSSFADNPGKINVFEIFKHYMPESADDIRRRVKVI